MNSVEWLWEQIDNLIPYQDINSAQQFNGLLEHAKEMHKEEHSKTWDSAIIQHEKRGYNIARSYSDFDDYYLEKFKKD